MADEEVPAGPRILLRRPRVDDAVQRFARVTSDPRVTEYLSWLPRQNVDDDRTRSFRTSAPSRKTACSTGGR
jgi:RimJ/RimL family protein N-acetyltransferase